MLQVLLILLNHFFSFQTEDQKLKPLSIFKMLYFHKQK